MIRSILITGGAGFIGSNFIRHMIRKESDIRIVNLDALTYAGCLENLKDISDPERYIFIQGDVGNRVLVENLMQGYRIDTVVHFAAETHVDRSLLDPDLFLRSNILGTCTLLEAARKYWMNEKNDLSHSVRFHHISTDEVFGSLNPKDPPFSEGSPYAPSSPYAASKAASDHFVRAYYHSYGLPTTITNCSNNYGPYQFPEKMVALTILNALQGLSLPIYGDGNQIRDWLFVEDHCEAIRMVLERGEPGERYLLGGGSQLTNLEMVRSICAILDERFPESEYTPHEKLIQFIEDRPGHDRRYALDTSKIQRSLGWTPRTNLETGLRATVNWYIEHPEWLSAIVSRPAYQEWITRHYPERGDW